MTLRLQDREACQVAQRTCVRVSRVKSCVSGRSSDSTICMYRGLFCLSFLPNNITFVIR